MTRSKDIGTRAESAVVAYLRAHGWPTAERRALAGAADLGDIVGTPGLVWEIKGGYKAETAGDGIVASWLLETESERINARADVGVLVMKQRAYGPKRAGFWSAAMTVGTAAQLLEATTWPPEDATLAPVRMHLATAVTLLRAAGYGTPLPAEDAAA
jgi:hypothetical protein